MRLAAHYVGWDMEMLAYDRLGASSSRRRAGAAAARRRSSTAAYYDTHADEYAIATMSLDVSERIARFAGMLPPGSRVLDAGCGAGRDLIGLRAAGLHPVGLDTSPALVEIARQTSGGHAQVGDIRHPPFAPAYFEGVWAMASLLHLERGETTGALEALSTVLVPGGVLFASVKRGAGRVSDKLGRWFTLHDEKGWEHHLREAGLQVIEIVGEPPQPLGAVGSVRPGWISSLARRTV